MKNYPATLDILERLAVQFDGIREAAAMLREIGPYDTALATAQAQAQDATAELAKTKGAIEQAKREYEQIQDAGLKTLREADEAATQIVARAQVKAEKVLQEGLVAAKVRVEAAQAEHETVMSGLRRDQQEETARLMAIKKQVAEMEQQALATAKQVAKAQTALQAIQEKARQLGGA